MGACGWDDEIKTELQGKGRLDEQHWLPGYFDSNSGLMLFPKTHIPSWWSNNYFMMIKYNICSWIQLHFHFRFNNILKPMFWSWKDKIPK